MGRDRSPTPGWPDRPREHPPSRENIRPDQATDPDLGQRIGGKYGNHPTADHNQDKSDRIEGELQRAIASGGEHAQRLEMDDQISARQRQEDKREHKVAAIARSP